jgi:hypothetical protein
MTLLPNEIQRVTIVRVPRQTKFADAGIVRLAASVPVKDIASTRCLHALARVRHWHAIGRVDGQDPRPLYVNESPLTC